MPLCRFVTVIALAAVSQAFAGGPYFATGIKIGEVAPTRAIVWVRLTESPTRVGIEAPLPTVLYRDADTGELFERTRDLGLIPEAELVHLDRKFGSRYAIAEGVAKDAPTYLKDLRRVAALAGAPEEGDRAALGDALQSVHAPIRYWAATGLGNLDDSKGDAHRMLALALADPSPTVRVAAALARCRVESDVSRAVETLIRELASGQEWVPLQAALALDSIGERARDAVPALQAALEDRENKYVVRVANHALNELLGTTNEVR